ncbi:efflux RND transporter periplasmic adaptor subunit [Pontiellaceae bacterium B12219]|nr:efflux RND transporter periplasmic adaptor subunit [Pontiellaceae bacterium B12219]
MKLNKKLITGIFGGILALVVIVLISAAGARKKEKSKHVSAAKLEQNSAPRAVRFEEVKAQPRNKPRRFPGTVKASEETALSFRVGGPLTEVNVVLGEPVKKGDLLMQIDPRDFQDRIQSLEAELAGAVALQENAKQDYKRVAGLFEQKVVPQSDYDRAKSVLDSSTARVNGLDAQLLIARHALEDTSLRAPYDGTVTKQLVENHEMIKAGEVVLHYHNIQTLEITVQIPENEIATTPRRANVAVQVYFPSIQKQSFQAFLKEWSTEADPLTRTYELTFAMEAPENYSVLPGMTAQVVFPDSRNEEAVFTVPVSALVADASGGSSVWIYDKSKNTAALRTVMVGELNGASRVVIEEGLSEGDLVVVTGSRLIHDKLPLKSVAIQ